MMNEQLYERRRLCQTKLDNIEQTITSVRRQQEQLRQFITIKTELSQQQEQLYRLNKIQASFLNEQRELERFEEFEPVNGRFQRIHTLNKSIAQARQRLKQLAIEIDEAQRLTDEASQSVLVENGNTEKAVQSLFAAAMTMAEEERLSAQKQGAERNYNDGIKELQLLTERRAFLHKEREELLTTMEQQQEALTALQLKHHALEAHKQMILHEEAIQLQLDNFMAIGNKREQLTQELNVAIHRQDEHNELLGRLFAENQILQAKINAKKEEIDGHRRSIAGQDSYNLQRRALELRSRKLMLETGSSLWRSIATGFDLMEQEEQSLTQLRLHEDHLHHDLDKLEDDLRQINKQLEQKQYHLTLTKSQNVIELRGDLREGTPCTVCGATHHPWQGESITEQNALIASLKADCETLCREQNNKQRQWQELQTDLTATKTRLEVIGRHLDDLQSRQAKDIHEWQHFCHLDPSFKDCSPSTNREARTTMLGLLIDKTSVNAEEAEKELKTFTFHLDAISTNGAELQKLQQQAAELAVQLNEANTACQVLSRQVELFNQQLQTTLKTYSRHYDHLQNTITLPDWYALWKTAPETVKMRIQQIREQWDALEQELTERRQLLEVCQKQEELYQRAIKHTLLDMTSCEGHNALTQEQAEKANNAIEKLLITGNGRSHFQQTQQQLAEQKVSLEHLRDNHLIQLRNLIGLQAQSANLEDSIHEMEQDLADERQELDLWMRHYNTTHPPVQMVELERVLVDDKEWGEVRRRVRENQIGMATTQNRIDYLRAQIIALQAEGLRPIADNGESDFIKLQEQIEELKKQQRDTLQQLAQYDLQLAAQEASTAPAL